jgi:hypothetical protein
LCDMAIAPVLSASTWKLSLRVFEAEMLAEERKEIVFRFKFTVSKEAE